LIDLLIDLFINIITLKPKTQPQTKKNAHGWLHKNIRPKTKLTNRLQQGNLTQIIPKSCTFQFVWKMAIDA